jgi:hypothetical protein
VIFCCVVHGKLIGLKIVQDTTMIHLLKRSHG